MHRAIFRLREPYPQDAGARARQALHNPADQEAPVDGRCLGLGPHRSPDDLAVAARAQRADTQAHAQPRHRRHTHAGGECSCEGSSFAYVQINLQAE